MGLETYRSKRDFDITPEPERDRYAQRSKDRLFVVQKHAASHLHYDLRLEIDGVLKSWAVPKGPSLDPRDKRLAIQVEDHPLSYADFEGMIPAGQYGAGAVIIWDKGTWTPLRGLDDYQRGRLTFQLHGEKLRGAFTLVRMGSDSSNKNWLLMKQSDEFARSESVVERSPASIASGMQIEELIAQNRSLARRRKDKSRQ